MDDIVKQAMAKWPNVPHCYGWLALDARGNWRMRDERCQALNLPGDMIRNATLLNFIRRNYLHDDAGRWYFQNGPQRVYVDLEIAPYVCRTDPQQGFVLHTGVAMPAPHEAVLTPQGDLIFAFDGNCAALDDRDMAACLSLLRLDDQPFDEKALATWNEKADPGPASVCGDAWNTVPIKLLRLDREELPARYGFQTRPRAQ